MEKTASLPKFLTPSVVSALAIVFVIGIFIVDTATTLDIAIAVLYVVVVLLAANIFQRRGVLLVAAGCLTLTVLSFLLSHGMTVGTALVRSLVGLLAIIITTVLALKNQSANRILREQAQLLDLTHDTVFVRDMNDIITYWNRGAEQLYGWSRTQAVGQVSHMMLQTIFPAPLEEITAELLQTGRWEGELIHAKRDGTKVIVASRWSLQQDERRRPVAILETNNDISERKRAEDALIHAQSTLAHVNRVVTLETLTASIAHEVKQPLVGVVTSGNACLRWLAVEPPNVEAAQRSLERVIRDGHRAGEVIDQIRALVKKSPPKEERLDINDVILDVIALTRTEVHQNGTSLRTELARKGPLVLGDRVQLQQVVLNLVINAIEALSGLSEGPRELWISTGSDAPNSVLVQVRDTGPGLENFERLFEAFYTTKPSGMGMGLSICRSIVEAHGGRLWATPNVPRGAVFQFRLPSEGEEVVPSQQPQLRP